MMEQFFVKSKGEGESPEQAALVRNLLYSGGKQS